MNSQNTPSKSFAELNTSSTGPTCPTPSATMKASHSSTSRPTPQPPRFQRSKSSKAEQGTRLPKMARHFSRSCSSTPPRLARPKEFLQPAAPTRCASTLLPATCTQPNSTSAREASLTGPTASTITAPRPTWPNNAQSEISSASSLTQRRLSYSFSTSIAWREAWKYRDRAYRYCLHDIGHAWQSLALAARADGMRELRPRPVLGRQSVGVLPPKRRRVAHADRDAPGPVNSGCSSGSRRDSFVSRRAKLPFG